VGVSKKFLEREHEKALKEEVTPNCRANCSGCGATVFEGEFVLSSIRVKFVRGKKSNTFPIWI